ncbi:MAG: hypothetical protein IJX36_09140, partial [Thermoguttaceae bacterium]|nr:hypothetical protein [Thermoguttaceae bacterium]MBQ9127674.1 hypothetical protein [Thermoguttaceae bacterium]
GARFAFVAKAGEAEKIDLTGAKLDGCRFDRKGFPSWEQWQAIRAARVETSSAGEASPENAE